MSSRANRMSPRDKTNKCQFMKKKKKSCLIILLYDSITNTNFAYQFGEKIHTISEISLDAKLVQLVTTAIKIPLA